tara:strand:- start:25312 stop:26109 length:798 start_codon:yes stop_codon:yes gene_type:complete
VAQSLKNKAMLLKLFIPLFIVTQFVAAQVDHNSSLYKQIKESDSIIFEQGFNRCNFEAMAAVTSENFEFYHDKGGITSSKADFVESIKQNICGSQDKMRRELVPNSLDIFPLENNGEIYGAIEQGKHLFYAKPKDRSEYLTGSAQFTQLWLKEDGIWKIKRVLSYDHGPGNRYTIPAKITYDQLRKLAGTYNSEKTGNLKIITKDSSLVLTAGDKKYELYPSSDSLFFYKDANLIFEFLEDPLSDNLKLEIRDHGALADTAVKDR